MLWSKKRDNPWVKEVDEKLQKVLWGCRRFQSRGNYTIFGKEQFLAIVSKLKPETVFREERHEWILYHFEIDGRTYFLELRKEINA